MSNELSILKGSNLPAYARADADTVGNKLAGGTGGVKRISIRGSVWRLMNGNEELGVNDSRTLSVVIVDAAPSIYRTYYARKFVEGENASPACWSIDGKTPAATVPAESRQNDTCAHCPQNIKGSAEGDRKACRFQHRVAIALPDDPEGDLMQMIFPATSLLGDPKNGYYPLRAYAKLLAQNNVRMDSVITEMKFDTDVSTPKVMFKPIGFVEEHVVNLLAERRDAGECAPLLEMDFIPTEGTSGQASEADIPVPVDETESDTSAGAVSGNNGKAKGTAKGTVAAATGKGTRHAGFKTMEVDDDDGDGDGDGDDETVDEPAPAASKKSNTPVTDHQAKLREAISKFRKPTAAS